jgi:adenylosuccinate synthase
MLLNTVEKMKLEIEELEGQTMSWADVRAECKVLAEQYKHWPAKIVESMPPSGFMVFEGAQGVLLDEKHGQAPHNTWTNTTFENADTLLDEIRCKDRFRIGCLRTYHTRHGAGPFPTENNTLDLPELHNGTGEFQGAFRVGDFNNKAARRAIEIVGGIDGLALSHIDYLDRLGYHHADEDVIRMIGEEVSAPIVMKANGPTAAHRTLELPVYA